MVKQKVKEKEKERASKLKALRQELEKKIEEQLPETIANEEIRVEVQKVDDGAGLDPEQAKRVVEALLFAASKPLTAQEIRKTMKSFSVAQITKMVKALKKEYEENKNSFEILEIANGFEIATRKAYAPWIMKIELQKKAKQVTQSALECLAILAYKQPITRAEVEELRGVDVSGVMSTLMDRGLSKIVGKKDVPGRPFLYGTTDKFLEHFGLKSLKDLPDISEIHTLVETSVRRDELIGTKNVVQVSEDSEDAPQAQDETESASESEPEEQDEGKKVQNEEVAEENAATEEKVSVEGAEAK